MRPIVGTGVAVCLLVAAAAAAQPRHVGPRGLAASLRASARADLPGAAGLTNLAELPHYALDMNIDMARGRYELREVLDYRNDTGTPLGEVVLRVYANAVSGPAPVALAAAQCPDVPCTTVIDNATSITFRPATPLPPGERLRMQVDLVGTPRVTDPSRTTMLAQGLEGLASLENDEHRGDYGLLSVGDSVASFANFYAVIARRDSSGWVRSEATTMGDLGSDHMANVEAMVRIDEGFTVVSTGITESRRVVDGRAEHRIVAAMVRDFALLTSDRLVAEVRQVGDVTVRSWFLPEERATGRRVLDVAAASFRIFERRFGGYPYTELDVVEAPLVGGAGGVEFAGLVTVASMFYRPSGLDGLGGLARLAGLSGGGVDQDRAVEMVTAHEVAHQWWHGLVGSDSRAHPFVDESLAQWSALLYLEDRYGARRARQDGESQVKMNYRMMRMMGRPDGPVNRPVDAFDSSLEYAGLVYGKGVYVYPALRRVLGDHAFFAAVRDYVERYRYRTAPRGGLVELLTQGRRARRATAVARHWLDESHGDDDIGTGQAAAAPGTPAGTAPGGGTGNQDVNALLRSLRGSGAGSAGPSPAELRQLEGQLEEIMRGLGSPP
ncbi:MAG: M1 family metallopeptidase [Deltaproteobacteria bacterium]|nr:M1 family metallopeptidase [Deltaproteobacteria bacterium]